MYLDFDQDEIIFNNILYVLTDGKQLTHRVIAENLGNVTNLAFSSNDAVLAICVQNEIWIIKTEVGIIKLIIRCFQYLAVKKKIGPCFCLISLIEKCLNTDFF